MSDNWVVQNLENALETWNEKLSEIWTLITTTPQNFKGGGIWSVIVNINGRFGYRLGTARFVFRSRYGENLRFVLRCEETEHALKLFIRFALAKVRYLRYGADAGAVQYRTRYDYNYYERRRLRLPQQTTLPAEMVTTIEDCGF